MKITVAICTWNRFALLKETLEHLARVAIPPGIEWELLVVNNNSTDDTDVVLSSFAKRLPLRTVMEKVPGLSNARNHAVREAKGDYLLWTDDDVLVDEHWMAAYYDAFTRRPEAAIFGGNIEPWFAGTPPKWLLRVWPRVASAYASRELGETEVVLSDEVLPFGANFAVRTAEQRRYLYDPQLGVRPDNIMGGEETTLIRRMLADGISGLWVPQARVRHYIPEKRQHDGGNIEPMLFGTPRWLWREAVMRQTKYLLNRYVSRPEVWIEDLIASSQARGQLAWFRAKLKAVEASQHVEHTNNEMI
jgi:glycosyltransferase involved in cell wall biosynthesis